MPVTNYTVVNGRVLSENRNGTKRDYVSDSLGNTVALLDSTQAKTDTFTYWPYGEVRTRTGTNVTPFLFVGTFGYYRDSAQRTYVRARYLAMWAARWLSQDPIGLAGEDWNRYRYVQDDPTNSTDQSGLRQAKEKHKDTRCDEKTCGAQLCKQIIRHLDDACGRVNRVPEPLGPFSSKLRDCLGKRCQNVRIHCKSKSDKDCVDAQGTYCGVTKGPGGGRPPWTNDNNLCGWAFVPGHCYKNCLAVPILHEMVHSCGHTEDGWPKTCSEYVYYGPGSAPCPKFYPV